jgi:hypothetical protein
VTYKDLSEPSDDDLQRSALECFKESETRGGQDKVHLLLEAQAYMQELDRRNDKKVTARDLKYERWTVGLVVLSIVVSVVALLMMARAANEQTRVLVSIEEATGKTVMRLDEIKTTLAIQSSKSPSTRPESSSGRRSRR